jgi:hypothetical protein
MVRGVAPGEDAIVDRTDLEQAAFSRFLKAFAIVAGGLIGVGALCAALADPLLVFGTGWIESIFTSENEEKPAAFLSISPPPQAVVIGSSRVMKINPACLKQATGLQSFNFGLSNSVVEGWDASLRFAHEHGPIKQVVLGVDVEGFNAHNEVDPRLTTSKYLRDYVGAGSRLTFDKVTRALFGMQALRFTFSTLRYHFSSQPVFARPTTFSSDGFITYTQWEGLERRGELPRAQILEQSRRVLTQMLWSGNFDELSPQRLALFVRMLEYAKREGIVVDAYVTMVQPTLAHVAAWQQVATRTAELEQLLTQLDRQHLLRYHPFSRVEDFGGDPAFYFDGLHMTEANTSRLVSWVFHQVGVCGASSLHAPAPLNGPSSAGN